MLSTPPDAPSDDTILRYLAGTLDVANAEKVRWYLEVTPGMRGVTKGLREVLQIESLAEKVPDTSRSLADVFARMEGETQAHPRMKPLPLGATKLRKQGAFGEQTLRANSRVRVAVLVVGIGLMLLFGAGIVSRGSRSGSPESGRTYVTATGQLATVHLRDGSHVTLAPRTTFTVGDAFGVHMRTVTVRGEAYFDVVSTSRAPFIVRTPRGGTVRVLGTTFNVMTPSADGFAGDETQIVVQTGRVRAIAACGAMATVSAGSVARLTDSTIIMSAADVSRYTSWTSGTLVFDDTPVSEVLAVLSRWYGMRFRLADTSLANVPLTARFAAHSSSGALTILKTVLHVTLTFDHAGDTTVVTLHTPKAARDGRDIEGDVREPVKNLRDILTIHREPGR